jgi:transcription termination/antitermination protein NusG
MKESEIKRILLRNQPAAATATQAKVKVIHFKSGQIIRIMSGPFADFEGEITEINAEKEKLKAKVSIFGRDTPVELFFNQVQEIT